MKTLYIIRHSKAEERSYSAMMPDQERNLISKGIMDAAKIGNFLKVGGHPIGHFISSKANRAYQTAKGIAEQLKFDTENIVIDESLYGGGPRAYLKAINELNENHKEVAIVGHNPDVSFFAEYLTRDDVEGELRTSSVIILTFENQTWAEISSKSGSFIKHIDLDSLVHE